jgi:hypothetical protein
MSSTAVPPSDKKPETSDPGGPVPQSGELFPGGPLDRAVAFVTEHIAQAVGLIVIVALSALTYLDYRIFLVHGGPALSQAVVAESEAWIAAAASIGLFLTARHVRRLAEAIAERTIEDRPPVEKAIDEAQPSPPPSAEPEQDDAPP